MLAVVPYFRLYSSTVKWACSPEDRKAITDILRDFHPFDLLLLDARLRADSSRSRQLCLPPKHICDYCRTNNKEALVSDIVEQIEHGDADIHLNYRDLKKSCETLINSFFLGPHAVCI